MKEYLLPVRVVDSSNIANEEMLYQDKGLYALINYDVETWNQYFKIEGLGSYVVLDFGKEICGGVRAEGQ